MPLRNKLWRNKDGEVYEFIYFNYSNDIREFIYYYMTNDISETREDIISVIQSSFEKYKK